MIIRNKFKKISKERLGRVLCQDLIDIIRLSPEFLKEKYPTFQHENLDAFKHRFVEDINNLYNILTTEAQFNINRIINRR